MRLVAFLMTTVVTFFLLAVATVIVIEKSGGSVSECDRGECGSLGEFTMEQTWPLVPLGFLAISLGLAWCVTRRPGRRRV